MRRSGLGLGVSLIRSVLDVSVTTLIGSIHNDNDDVFFHESLGVWPISFWSSVFADRPGCSFRRPRPVQLHEARRFRVDTERFLGVSRELFRRRKGEEKGMFFSFLEGSSLLRLWFGKISGPPFWGGVFLGSWTVAFRFPL